MDGIQTLWCYESLLNFVMKPVLEIEYNTTSLIEKDHLGDWSISIRPRAVVGYGVKIFLPGPPNYVTRSPGKIYCSQFIKPTFSD